MRLPHQTLFGGMVMRIERHVKPRFCGRGVRLPACEQRQLGPPAAFPASRIMRGKLRQKPALFLKRAAASN
jgi:hypothetical protein